MEIKSIIAFMLITFLICVECGGGNVNNEEFYKLLGVSKTATTKQIRMAFKKLALEKHPDKNKDDPNANELFIKINRAYETLKDEDLRKKYDMYGEEGLKDNHQSGHNYQSWQFYNQNFGIYDEDPEIVTLTRSDFMQFVDSNQDTIWFVNFYSTQCSHCHDLAPTWRELAKQLDGVIKIGAVNCMDDWHLCNTQQIQSFPSLIMYPQKQKFVEHKTLDNLLKFALSFASGTIHNIKSKDEYKIQLNKGNNQPWLITYCLSNQDHDQDESELNYELNCLDDNIQTKLSIMLHGLVNLASIDCNNKESKELCKLLKPHRSMPIVYYSCLPDVFTNSNKSVNQEHILTTDYKRIVELVLSYLPKIKHLELDEFESKLDLLRDLSSSSSTEKPWLVQFVNLLEAPNQNNEYKRLPSLLGSDFNFGQYDCALVAGSDKDCRSRFQIVNYPTFVLFKSVKMISPNIKYFSNEQDWYEVYYSSRQSPQDISKFVKDNAFTPVRTLNSFDLTNSNADLIKNDKLAYFVDFFAPWCPPCMNLLPEFRKSSKLEGTKDILFATIDCTVNTDICERYNIRSYPTTVLFNSSTPHNYIGHHSAEDISDFVQDILRPSVITLTYDTFYSLVGSKPKGKIWLIDFFASWCQPCQQLAPEWRKLAKRIDSNIGFVGQVDCVVEQRLCSEVYVNSYPNIRIFPADHEGSEYYEQYQGWMRDSNSLFQWASDYFPSKSYKLDMENFERLVMHNLKSNPDQQPWLVDFFAPWCGHCQVFSPTFEALAAKLEGKVKLGKVNCQIEQYLCQIVGIRAFPTIRFYPMAPSGGLDWSSGEDIELYDYDSILRLVNNKIKLLGYKTSVKDEL